jgi:hypothetical protein
MEDGSENGGWKNIPNEGGGNRFFMGETLGIGFREAT